MSKESKTKQVGKSNGNGKQVVEWQDVAIRFAGDSGDGMQLTGDRFATISATMGDEVVTFADYPSEIRAPVGSIAGVSGFQLRLGSEEVFTPGDLIDVLIAMNPAAFKVNLARIREGGIIIVNADAFTDENKQKAGFKEEPLSNHVKEKYRVYEINISKLTQAALAESSLSPKQVDRCKNFFALGIVCWLFQRPIESTIEWIQEKFAKKPDIVDANVKAITAGFNYAQTTEEFSVSYVVPESKEKREPGYYRYIDGNTAAALGLVAAAKKSGLKLFLGSYPITPATDILHELSRLKNYDVIAYQAEDEIAGIGTAIGASFAGALAATSTSGPGLALKSEFIGLAVITELPLVIVDVQRAGPSTGLPTKSEQADLMQAIWGRHGESPVVVLAARSSKDCFYTAYEAARIALKYMTPVIMLSDGSLANGSEPWKIPSFKELDDIKVKFHKDPKTFKPYARDKETLARPWAIPGTPGLTHRIGGLEKEDILGTVSHDPLNHEKMVRLRAEKVARVAKEIPPTKIIGDPNGKLLLIGWGSTYGVIRQAVRKLHEKERLPVACVHLRYINPLPPDLEGILKKFPKVLFPENNLGQLSRRLRAEYLINVEQLNKIQGVPFTVEEIASKARSLLGEML